MGGQNVAGGKLKEAGSNHWIYQTNATNESGFTALPGGIRYGTGSISLGNIGTWWSATSYIRQLSADQIQIPRYDNSNKSWGCSVRCIKDDNISAIDNLDNTECYYIYPNPAKYRLYVKNNKLSNP